MNSSVACANANACVSILTFRFSSCWHNVQMSAHRYSVTESIWCTSPRLSSVFNFDKTLWCKAVFLCEKIKLIRTQIKRKNAVVRSCCTSTSSQCIPIDSCKYRIIRIFEQSNRNPLCVRSHRVRKKSTEHKVWLMFANLCNKIRTKPESKLPNSYW